MLTLSHWPRSETPPALRRDLSAEIAFAALDRRRPLPRSVAAVTNDHFDADGLAGVFALFDPERAEPLRARLVAFARAGDFDVAADEAVACSVLAAAALVDPTRGALLAPADLTDTNRRTAAAYEALLPRLPELLEHPERFAALIAEERAALAASKAAFAKARATVNELPELDLAVVTLAPAAATGAFAIGHRGALPLHPLALHSATAASRVLVICGARRSYHDRYESWVAYTSRALPRRRDLGALARRLSALEAGGATWTADPPGALVAVLDHEGESAITPERLVGELVAHLRTSPPAWDPYAPPPARAGRRVS